MAFCYKLPVAAAQRPPCSFPHPSTNVCNDGTAPPCEADPQALRSPGPCLDERDNLLNHSLKAAVCSLGNLRAAGPPDTRLTEKPIPEAANRRLDQSSLSS